MTREEMLKAVDEADYMTNPANGTTSLYDTIFALRQLIPVVRELIPPEPSAITEQIRSGLTPLLETLATKKDAN